MNHLIEAIDTLATHVGPKLIAILLGQLDD